MVLPRLTSGGKNLDAAVLAPELQFGSSGVTLMGFASACERW